MMCVEYEQLLYENSEELKAVVHHLTNKFRNTFDYFFANYPELLDESKEANAVKRLEAMDKALADLADQPPDVVDGKFAVHGGHRNHSGGGTQNINGNTVSFTKDRDALAGGKSFHIFQASPPHTASTVVNNWLMGLFEPNALYSFMIHDREQTLRHNDETVPIDTTIGEYHSAFCKSDLVKNFYTFMVLCANICLHPFLLLPFHPAALLAVTKTHILDLMQLYKKFRPQFDEIFFVVSNRGTDPKTRIDGALCEYTNGTQNNV